MMGLMGVYGKLVAYWNRDVGLVGDGRVEFVSWFVDKLVWIFGGVEVMFGV